MPSLLEDPVTNILWQRVQNLSSYENQAQSFWHHVYTKEFFPERSYVVDYEEPPIEEEQGKRKVDQIVSQLVPDWGTLYILLFHEIKRNEISNADLEWVENQAYLACESYCKKHDIGVMYAQTSVGTRARFFVYKPGSWEPTDGRQLADWDAYLEFGDRESEKEILGMIKHIKKQGPALPKITWVWDQTRQKHYYLTPIYYIYEDGSKIVRK
ncbi:hypothetical protein EK21DRAFT_119451 [Setomelanomma holmii]|uniref:Uncharacterized protein n=1 Tax=Setomelanomma holmii TaxID=210430 RepID=A0A9P4LEZ1_9PLEO|nr:hypothetical protein EK21DRAFT_119451 [Setomelanomma holmii]